MGGNVIKQCRILVVETDDSLALKLAANLGKAGYIVTRVADVRTGLEQLQEASPDLIIMAKDLPPVDGENPCQWMRRALYVPIIVLGNRGEASTVLELGADAYVPRPPNTAEIVARVKSLLRRTRPADPKSRRG